MAETPYTARLDSPADAERAIGGQVEKWDPSDDDRGAWLGAVLLLTMGLLGFALGWVVRG